MTRFLTIENLKARVSGSRYGEPIITESANSLAIKG